MSKVKNLFGLIVLTIAAGCTTTAGASAGGATLSGATAKVYNEYVVAANAMGVAFEALVTNYADPVLWEGKVNAAPRIERVGATTFKVWIDGNQDTTTSIGQLKALVATSTTANDITTFTSALGAANIDPDASNAYRLNVKRYEDSKRALYDLANLVKAGTVEFTFQNSDGDPIATMKNVKEDITNAGLNAFLLPYIALITNEINVTRTDFNNAKTAVMAALPAINAGNE